HRARAPARAPAEEAARYDTCVIAARERQQSLNCVRFVTSDPGSVTIDSNGNLTQKVEGSTTWTYEWNAENQLKRVLQNGSEVARYAYDPLGRRVEKVAGGATTTWTYDAEDILREISGTSTLKYVHGPGIDEPQAQEDGTGTLSYFHADGLGSVVKTTNAAGTAVSSKRYDAFGNPETGATNGFSYTGRELDTEAGLYYYRARYYDPKIGRFLSEDPIPLEARDHAEANAYVYVRNNPPNRKDPFGLESGNIWRDFPPNEKQPAMCPFEPDKCVRWGPQWQDWGFSSSDECVRWVWLRTGGPFITGRRLPQTPQGRAASATYRISTGAGAWLACNVPVCLQERGN
ncbi:MAG TPA: RHS repeat-associated core domain-containing protein, partial [Vicinamibacteria bacterium]